MVITAVMFPLIIPEKRLHRRHSSSRAAVLWWLLKIHYNLSARQCGNSSRSPLSLRDARPYSTIPTCPSRMHRIPCSSPTPPSPRFFLLSFFLVMLWRWQKGTFQLISHYHIDSNVRCRPIRFPLVLSTPRLFCPSVHLTLFLSTHSFLAIWSSVCPKRRRLSPHSNLFSDFDTTR